MIPPSGEARGVALRVDHARKAYRRKRETVTALDSVSFSIVRGERVALLGPNGSGKTTLIKSLCSLIRLDEGTVTVEGHDIAGSRAHLERIGVVLEGARNVYWRMTPYENARYFAGLRGRGDRDARIRELLEVMEIPGARTREVGELSLGNKQRVAIVCAMVHDPGLLLLDEPSLGLDVAAVSQLKRVIARMAGDDQRTFLITSHDLSFVEDVCDRVLVIRSGRIVYDGPLAELRARVSGYSVRMRLSGSGPLASGLDQAAARIDAGGVALRLAAETAADALSLLCRAGEHRDRIEDLEVGKSRLEEAYLGLL